MFPPKQIECSSPTRQMMYESLNRSSDWLSFDGSDTDDDYDDCCESSFQDSFATQLSLDQQDKLSLSMNAMPHYSFWCPISKKIMKEPVTTPQKYNFERKVIMKHLEINGHFCPLSGKKLRPTELKPNSKLQWEILYWQRKQGMKSKDYSKDTVCDDVESPPTRRCSRVDATLLSVVPSKIDSPPAAPRKSLCSKESSKKSLLQTNKNPEKQGRRRSLQTSTFLDSVEEKVDAPPFAPIRQKSIDKHGVGTLGPSPSNRLLSFNLALPSKVSTIPQGSPLGQECVLDILDEVIELGVFE